MYRQILNDWYDENRPDMDPEDRENEIEDRVYRARKDAEESGEFGNENEDSDDE